MMIVDHPGTIDDDRRWAEITVLLVEDNPLDAKATIRAARKLAVRQPIEVVTDGQQALDRLRASRPDTSPIGLVLLDLSLPGKDGHDILTEIRGDEVLCTTPVVILTSSTEPGDVNDAYRRGCNAYVTKPNGLDEWQQAMATIRDFWLSLAVLPRP